MQVDLYGSFPGRLNRDLFRNDGTIGIELIIRYVTGKAVGKTTEAAGFNIWSVPKKVTDCSASQ